MGAGPVGEAAPTGPIATFYCPRRDDGADGDHFLQNLWVAAFAVPQAVQTTASFAPHSGQNSASAGLSCWHRGHFMSTPTRRARLRSADDSVGAGEGQ